MGSSPVDGGTSTDDEPPTPERDAGDEPPEDGGLDDPQSPFGNATWGVRTCSIRIEYEGEGESQVRVAGEFTSWADGALVMNRVGTHFSIVIEPDATMTPGSLVAYKLIAGDTWLIDERAPYRKIVNGVLNSAFRVPECERPELLVAPFRASAAGSVEVVATLRLGHAARPPRAFTAELDGAALSGEQVTLDRQQGAFRLSLSGLARGKHRLSLRAEDVAGEAADPVELPFWVEGEPFDPRHGVLYMIMIDRFANGDSASDRPSGGNVEVPADWHGGDLVGARRALESGYLDVLGVRTIWLSPVNQQVDGGFPGKQGDPHHYSAYHGYWPVRARQVDDRFGGDAALRGFVEAAHARGMRVLIDLINNQVHEQHEYVPVHHDWFRFADTSCVCAATPGCGWDERPVDCLFDPFLPDIDWQVPEAEEQFASDALHWIEAFDLDGFRVDAVKHVEPTSIFNLRARLAQRFEQGGQRIYMFGETAVAAGSRSNLFGQEVHDGYEWVDLYVGSHALDGQFDFPTHNRMRWDLLTDSVGYDVIEAAAADIATRYQPGGIHVRFLGSQDSSRSASMAAMDPGRDCKWASSCGSAPPPLRYDDPALTQRLIRAYTWLYTMPGIPFLYMGDELAMPGGADPDNRRDFPWTGELAALRMGHDTSELGAEQEALQAWMRELGSLRARSRVLAHGTRRLLHVSRDLYAYALERGSELALVVINRGPALAAQELGSVSVATLDSALGQGSASITNGRVSVTLGAGKAAVFVTP